MRCPICRQPLVPAEAVSWQHKDWRYPSGNVQVIEKIHAGCRPADPTEPEQAA